MFTVLAVGHRAVTRRGQPRPFRRDHKDDKPPRSHSQPASESPRSVVAVARPGVLCCTLGVDAALRDLGSGDAEAGKQPPSRRDGSPRLFRWRQRTLAPPPPPVATSYRTGDTVVIVPGADFICCTYKGCGTLRPLTDVASRTACAGCGRV
jgi:hypothetical protein